MSKSRNNHKWFDDEDVVRDKKTKQVSELRRNAKKMKNVLRSKNFDLNEYEKDTD